MAGRPDRVSQIFLTREVLEHAIGPAVLEAPVLVRVVVRVAMRDRRAAAGDEPIVHEHDARASPDAVMEAVEEGAEPPPRNVRPPEAGERGGGHPGLG